MTSESATLREGTQQFRQLLDTAPDAMVVVTSEGLIEFVNLQTERLFGYMRSELLHQRLDLLIPERYRADHGKHLERFFRSASARPMGSGLELFGRRKDGSELPIEVSLSPLQTEHGPLVSASIRDVSERRKILAEAKISADRLASAVENIQDAFALFDADDRLIQCNSVYRSLFVDRLEGPIVGRRYEDLARLWGESIFGDDEERGSFLAARLAERGNPRSSYDIHTSDGRRFRVMNRRTPEGGIVKTIWDLSQDMRREAELTIARREAEAGSAAKSEFLSSMSHELRTPLNAVLGFAQLLRRDKKEPLSPRHLARVDQILKGGEHLLRLIDDVLDLSRIEAGSVAISLEAVAVGAVLQRVQETLEPSAARAGIGLSIDEGGASGTLVLADPTRFAQVLLNFGSNAVKYNRPGGQVTFRVGREGERLRVSVLDTGMGIPADRQDSLFRPFQRAGQENGPIEGTGIGLTISKRLAEMMGGTVGFASEAGRGSTFWIELPVHEPVAVIASSPERDHVSRPQLAAERRLVLYVEDNPANIVFLEDVLGTYEGLEVVSVPNAELGIELARARRPDLVILDINLPGMSGFDALRVLRSWPETREIPVIALTAAASEHDRRRGEQAGFFRYLTKPVQIDELEAAVTELLRGTPVARPRA